MRFLDIFKRKIKTIFDYSPSEKELYLLGIEDKEKYLNGVEQKKAYVHLACAQGVRNSVLQLDKQNAKPILIQNIDGWLAYNIASNIQNLV